jgi:hypothetical protein
VFCSNCGAQLSNESNFCSKCGKPQKDGVVGYQSVPERIEYCQIRYDREKTSIQGIFNFLFDGGFDSPNSHIMFWADASGPNGTYNAGSTEWVTTLKGYPIGTEHSWIHSILKNKLLAENWEQIGSGERWYNDKFRRRIQPKSQGSSDVSSMSVGNVPISLTVPVVTPTIETLTERYGIVKKDNAPVFKAPFSRRLVKKFNKGQKVVLFGTNVERTYVQIKLDGTMWMLIDHLDVYGELHRLPVTSERK